MKMKFKIEGRIIKACACILIAAFLMVSFEGCKSNKNTSTTTEKPEEPKAQEVQFKIFSPDVANYDDGYIFYIYKGIEGKNPDITIKSGIKVDDVMDFKFVSDRVYFYSQNDGMIDYVDLNGDRSKLEFTKNEDNYNCEFVISPDGKKIAWVEVKSKSEGENTYIINMSDIDGKNKKEIYKKDLKIMTYLGLQKWSTDGSRIYFGRKFDGLGGLIVMENLESLYSLDVNTGKAEMILDKDRNYNNSEYISTVSDDDKFTAYFDGKLFIKNIENSNETSYDIPTKDYLAVGQAVFSPNNRYVLYDIIEGDPNDQENYSVKNVLVDTVDGKTGILKAPDVSDYTKIKWVSDTKVAFVGKVLTVLDVTSGNSFIPETTK